MFIKRLKIWRVAAALLAPLSVTAGTQEWTSQQVTLNIQAQPLGQALNALAEQTGLQIAGLSDAWVGLTAPRVVGTLSLQAALNRLLRNTSLQYQIIEEEKTIAIRATSTQPEPEEKMTHRASGEKALLQIADSSAAHSKLAFAVSTEEAPEPELNTEASTSSDIQADVVVTGSHIRGVKETAAPTITLTREELQRAGYARIEDTFRELPQNLAEFSPEGMRSDGSTLAARQNSEGISSISLRGLGPGSTLTLLNGTRRAPGLQGRAIDISLIPISMIERIDIATGGASAIYGSDAVAGVVNVTTRRDFQGMETQVSFIDSTHPGGERMQLSHILGATSDRGGFVVGYDFARDNNLDVVDTGLVEIPSSSGVTLIHGDMQPELTRHSGFVSGRFAVNDRLELYTDGMYTRNDNPSYYESTVEGYNSYQRQSTKNDAYSMAIGARSDLSSTWKVDISAARSVSSADYRSTSAYTNFDYSSEGTEQDESSITTASVVLDGPLFAVKGMQSRAAFGADFRKENFDDSTRSISSFEGNQSSSSDHVSGDRTVRAAFAELSLPIVTDGARPGLRRLEFSLGARYDRYSDFDSAVNEQAGMIWQPTAALTVRGTYATAYRAPDLWYVHGFSDLNLDTVADPTTGGVSPVLVRGGNGNSTLTPEEAVTWSAGIDWKPLWASWAKLSLSYFEIDYEDRIDRPIGGYDSVLIDEAKYVDLVNRHPTLAELESMLASTASFTNRTGGLYDPSTGAAGLLNLFPNLILLEARTANVAVENVRGLDFQVDANLTTAHGEFSFGLNSTYSIDHDRSITRTSPSIDLLNRVGKPVDLRWRATAGWTQGMLSAFAAINYVDSYIDDLALTPTKIDSWTTIDFGLRVDSSKLAANTFLEGTTLSLNASNLFNADPPSMRSDNDGLGYDSANSSALGRIVSVRFQKRW